LAIIGQERLPELWIICTDPQGVPVIGRRGSEAISVQVERVERIMSTRDFGILVLWS